MRKTRSEAAMVIPLTVTDCEWRRHAEAAPVDRAVALAVGVVDVSRRVVASIVYWSPEYRCPAPGKI
jgi:hypothetical protein